MYNLQKEFNSVLADVYAAGIKPHKIERLTVSTRTTRRLGQCSRKNGKYTINISSWMLDDCVSRQALHNTIAHEILHAVDGCFNHGTPWKNEAAKLMRHSPEYDISRTTSIASTGAVVKKSEYKYYLHCNKCGMLIKRKRMCGVVAHPEHYRCGKCGGSLTLEGNVKNALIIKTLAKAC